MNQMTRELVRIAKAKGYIKNYYALAELIGIKTSSLYSWLGG